MRPTLLAGSFQSGGFFVHLLIGEEATASTGTGLTRPGAVLLAIALISLRIRILSARSEQVPW